MHPSQKDKYISTFQLNLDVFAPYGLFHMSQTLWSPSNRFIKALTQNIQLPNYSRSY